MSTRNSKKPTKSSRMPPLLIVGGLLILVITLVILINRPAETLPTSSNGPALVSDLQEINLGDVKLGQYVQASFTLTNTGDKPLKFTKAPYIEVREGC